MVKRFVDRWKSKEKEETIVQKISNVGKPQENIKQQITEVTQRLDIQTKVLDAAVLRFQNRDKEIFNRVVKAMANHEESRANILATELSEIRKVEKMLSHASLALQSVSMRLNTVSEMGDIVAVLSPAKSLLNGIRSEMCSIMPEASQELGNIGNLLGEIVTTTNQGTDIPMNSTAVNEDALQILQEAEVAAAKHIEDRFPQVDALRPTKRMTGVEA